MEGLFPILMIAVVIGVAVLGWYMQHQRRKELMAWAAAHGLSFDTDHDHSVEDRYPEFRCFQRGMSRYGFNRMVGDWQGRTIEAMDYHYETQSTDSKGRTRRTSHHFSAVVLYSDVPLRPLFIRPEGLFDKITEFFGADDIDFESAEFSRKFYVKADDRRWAFDVIHQRAMAFLLAQPRFTLQFAPTCVIAWRNGRFGPAEFEQAIQTIAGLLDGLPDYVVRQQRGQD